tara:strand:+ start:1900 stop:2352 length:453 start_codon:yes stop_codon:yes gene_type:complete
MYVVSGLTHIDLEIVWGSELPTASDKGYPAIFNKMSFWVLYHEEQVIAYTGSLRITDDIVLVGNTYIRKEHRNKGLHSFLLEKRNNSRLLKDSIKVTVINPIEDSKKENLIKVVENLGYKKVEKIGDISLNMPEDIFEGIMSHNKEIWRC